MPTVFPNIYLSMDFPRYTLIRCISHHVPNQNDLYSERSVKVSTLCVMLGYSFFIVFYTSRQVVSSCCLLRVGVLGTLSLFYNSIFLNHSGSASIMKI